MAPNPTILVVDDEPDIRELVRLHLAQEGYAVCEAETGERAVALAAAERPALIMLDLMLPGTDGLEVWAGTFAYGDRRMNFRLRTRRRGRRVRPMTSHRSLGDRARN